MPLYLMQSGEGEALQERLVEANNIQVARNFVARDLIRGEKASQIDLFRLAKAGKEIEVAIGSNDEEALAPAGRTGEGADEVEEAADSVAAGAIEGAGAAMEAGGDGRDVAAAAIGGAAAASAEATDKPKKK